MNVTMLLADSVQVADGKFYILGGGWSVTGPMPQPSAIAIKFEVQANEFDRPHHWELFLEDADGQLVMVETPEGPQTIEVRGDFTAAAAPDALDGTPVIVPIAINFGPIPLAPAGRYTWRLIIDGDSLEGSTASFSTRPMTPELL
jgi:hypothetical protein